MRSKPSHLGGISLDFAGIPPRWDENLSYEHEPARHSGIDFSLKRMHMFLNSFQIWFENGYDEYYQKK